MSTVNRFKEETITTQRLAQWLFLKVTAGHILLQANVIPRDADANEEEITTISINKEWKEKIVT